MARKIITGDVELEKKLKGLADKSADRVARAALGGAMTAVTKVMRKMAPVGATGNLKRSIGSRFEKGNKKNKPQAKVGINVGRRTKKQRSQAEAGRIVGAPHGHIVALGTKRRTRKAIGGKFAFLNPVIPEQLTTGVMPSDPFVRQAYEAARAAVTAAMTKRATKALAREVAKQQ
jgi:HK97 gp10 family phage protein